MRLVDAGKHAETLKEKTVKLDGIPMSKQRKIGDMRDAVAKRWAGGDPQTRSKPGFRGAEVVPRSAEAAPVAATQRGRKYGR